MSSVDVMANDHVIDGSLTTQHDQLGDVFVVNITFFTIVVSDPGLGVAPMVGDGRIVFPEEVGRGLWGVGFPDRGVL